MKQNSFIPLKYRLMAALACCISALMLYPNSALADFHNKIYTVGVVPQFDSRRIHSIWRPILDQIQHRTGLKFVLIGSSGIPEFEQEYKEGNFDLVYMDPLHMLKVNNHQGYLPMLRDTGSDLYGILVVRKDSPYQSVKELEGKRLAFPAPNALGASLMIRADLLNKFNIHFNPRFVKTHTSVYLNVALGEMDAPAVVYRNRCLNNAWRSVTTFGYCMKPAT